MVRLRDKNVVIDIKTCIEFQFQNGTIKSVQYPVCIRLINYFNSKMVRLRANLNYPLQAVLQNFNSKMVRLRGIKPLHHPKTPKFQFQNGTIKSRSKAEAGIFKANFNSKMVRLREIPVWRSRGLIFYFNSKMVRLRAVTKTAILAQFKPFYSHFNPKISSTYNSMIS